MENKMRTRLSIFLLITTLFVSHAVLADSQETSSGTGSEAAPQRTDPCEGIEDRARRARDRLNGAYSSFNTSRTAYELAHEDHEQECGKGSENSNDDDDASKFFGLTDEECERSAENVKQKEQALNDATEDLSSACENAHAQLMQLLICQGWNQQNAEGMVNDLISDFCS